MEHGVPWALLRGLNLKEEDTESLLALHIRAAWLTKWCQRWNCIHTLSAVNILVSPEDKRVAGLSQIMEVPNAMSLEDMAFGNARHLDGMGLGLRARGLLDPSKARMLFETRDDPFSSSTLSEMLRMINIFCLVSCEDSEDLLWVGEDDRGVLRGKLEVTNANSAQIIRLFELVDSNDSLATSGRRVAKFTTVLESLPSATKRYAATFLRIFGGTVGASDTAVSAKEKMSRIVSDVRGLLGSVISRFSDQPSGETISVSKTEYRDLTGTDRAKEAMVLKTLDIAVAEGDRASSKLGSVEMTLSVLSKLDGESFKHGGKVLAEAIKNALVMDKRKHKGARAAKFKDNLALAIVRIGAQSELDQVPLGLQTQFESKRLTYHIGGGAMTVHRPYSGGMFLAYYVVPEVVDLSASRSVFLNAVDRPFLSQAAFIRATKILENSDTSSSVMAKLSDPRKVLSVSEIASGDLELSMGSKVSTTSIRDEVSRLVQSEQDKAIMTRFVLDKLILAGYRPGTPKTGAECYYDVIDEVARPPRIPNRTIVFDCETPLAGCAAYTDSAVLGPGAQVWLVSESFGKKIGVNLLTEHLRRLNDQTGGDTGLRSRGFHLDKNSVGELDVGIHVTSEKKLTLDTGRGTSRVVSPHIVLAVTCGHEIWRACTSERNECVPDFHVCCALRG